MKCCVWLPVQSNEQQSLQTHRASSALDSKDFSTQTFSLKDDRRRLISLCLSMQAEGHHRVYGRTTEEGCKCSGWHSSRRLLQPFVLAGHDDSVTPVCLREPTRTWRNNKQLPALATAQMDLSNSLQGLRSVFVY